jgi:hypothetical protein
MGKVCSKSKKPKDAYSKKPAFKKEKSKMRNPEKIREEILLENIKYDSEDGEAYNDLGIIEYEKGTK